MARREKDVTSHRVVARLGAIEFATRDDEADALSAIISLQLSAGLLHWAFCCSRDKIGDSCSEAQQLLFRLLLLMFLLLLQQPMLLLPQAGVRSGSFSVSIIAELLLLFLEPAKI